ncbi:methionine--tRNA ligase [[Mycoplasma] falconis]|uniref:Methionine--tRNA ligase n=1 Tax=[Mycoplasma] falconis TaxID=92403 RepID=A0A501XAE8_9BACT|nr:methionine--tRNA ligase [[Mycoplasma] falconis]TPE57337.1 methionine--tRNA ligase [[Mycoplasma] falconis]
MKKKTFYITTPIYYPSGNLHIGHLLTTTLAWMYANYKRQRGYDVVFSTGIDEHGQKIQQKALANNMTPQAYVDMQAEKFVDLWKKLDIDYQVFSRTTNKNHEETVKLVFEKMLEKGFIYSGSYEGLYSISDEEFMTKSQAILKDGEYFHPVSGQKLELIKEESYFFKMSMFNDWIKQYFLNHPNFITNKATQKELLNNFIDKGLEDLSVTRITFDWGIKIDKKDNDKQHVIYVWLDALFSYLSGIGYLSKDQQQYEKYWANGDERVHMLAKEISRFHAIYWPIFLHSLDLNLPTKEVVHSWIITPEGKMSKSKGNVVEPLPLIEKYGAEPVKYFFSSQINIDNDFSFSEDLLINVLNADLANNFGNLLNRTVKMINQSFDNGTIFVENNLLDIDKHLLAEITTTYEFYCEQMDNYHADLAYHKAIEFSKHMNEYIDKNEPWKLKDNLERLNVVLNTLLQGIYAVNYMLSPVMPKTTAKVFNFLCQENLSESKLFDFKKFDNKHVDVKEILFARIKK